MSQILFDGNQNREIVLPEKGLLRNNVDLIESLNMDEIDLFKMLSVMFCDTINLVLYSYFDCPCDSAIVKWSPKR